MLMNLALVPLKQLILKIKRLRLSEALSSYIKVETNIAREFRTNPIVRVIHELF
ncbi:hypothetical protein LguiB_032347 [Lonicera macranthoides]